MLDGSVTCLKDGCNKTIPLMQRGRPNDGGKRDGFGSLSAYRVCATCVIPVLDSQWPLLTSQTHLSEHKALAMVKRGINSNTVLPKEASQYVNDVEQGA